MYNKPEVDRKNGTGFPELVVWLWTSFIWTYSLIYASLITLRTPVLVELMSFTSNLLLNEYYIPNPKQFYSYCKTESNGVIQCLAPYFFLSTVISVSTNPLAKFEIF